MKDKSLEINSVASNVTDILEGLEYKLQEEKKYIHHGYMTVYEHSLAVAYMSAYLVRNKKENYNYESIIKGALLHDYFLYDWHEPGDWHCIHGFTHPKIALKNAEQDFELTKIERDIIKHHMFPLTPCPPLTKEGWVVTCADKLCAIREYFLRERKRWGGLILKREYITEFRNGKLVLLRTMID